MVYDWEGREATMRALYIDQNKSLEEVMDWFRANQNFTPRYVCRDPKELYGDELRGAVVTVISASRSLLLPKICTEYFFAHPLTGYDFLFHGRKRADQVCAFAAREHFRRKSKDGTSLQNTLPPTQTAPSWTGFESYGLRTSRKRTC